MFVDQTYDRAKVPRALMLKILDTSSVFSRRLCDQHIVGNRLLRTINLQSVPEISSAICTGSEPLMPFDTSLSQAAIVEPQLGNRFVRLRQYHERAMTLSFRKISLAECPCGN